MASNDSANGRAVVDLTQDDQDNQHDSDVEIVRVRRTPGGRRRFRNALPPPRVYGRAQVNNAPCIKCVRRVMYGRTNINQTDMLCVSMGNASDHCAACIEDTACFPVAEEVMPTVILLYAAVREPAEKRRLVHALEVLFRQHQRRQWDIVARMDGLGRSH